MELRHYWIIARKWLWLMAVGIVLAGTTSYVVSKSMTRIYAATTTLQVNQAQSPTALDYQDLLMSERLTKTYGELIRKRSVLEEVIQQLNLESTYESFAPRVSVSTVRDTQLIQITVQDPNPEQAANIANKVAEVFISRTEESQGGQLVIARQNLRQQLASVEGEIRATAAALERLRTSPDGRSSEVRAAEEGRLQSTLGQYQLVYSQLVKSEQDLALAEMRSGGGVHVADPAVASTIPVQPKVLLNTLLAALVGLMLAAGTAFLVEYLDDTVKTPDDVERAVGLATLGAVGRIADKTGDGRSQLLGSEPDTKSLIGEAYRALRTNLQFATVGRPCRTIAVTSALAGEGKSTTVANLAVVLSQAGKRVLVVDTDFRRPSQHKIFRLSEGTGLTNLLVEEGEINPEPYLRETPFPGLRVIVTGPIPPNPSELLGSARMAEVVAALSREADLVLFDTPPVLAVADPIIVGSFVDGVALVVNAGGTRADVLARGVQALSQPGIKLLGAVLNRIHLGGGGYYYHYYYNRYYYSQNGNGRHHGDRGIVGRMIALASRRSEN